MNQPYLYDPKANVLRQRADKCDCMKGLSACFMPCEISKNAVNPVDYTPVSGWVPEVGKEYIPSVHFQVKEISSGFETETFISRVAVPIEQKYITTDLTKTKAQFIGQVIEQKQECKHEWTADTEDGKGTYCTECHIVLSKSPDRVFTLADMIECWEAAQQRNLPWPDDELQNDMKQYFKSKGINIDDQGK